MVLFFSDVAPDDVGAAGGGRGDDGGGRGQEEEEEVLAPLTAHHKEPNQPHPTPPPSPAAHREPDTLRHFTRTGPQHIMFCTAHNIPTNIGIVRCTVSMATIVVVSAGVEV